MNGNLLLGVLLFVCWLFLGSYWWACPLWENCPDENTTEVTPPATSEPDALATDNLTKMIPEFNWGNATLPEGMKFDFYRDSVQGLLKNEYQLLEIFGQYFAKEPNGEKLGMDRAKQLMALLMQGPNGLDSTRFRLLTEMIGDKADSLINHFMGVRFNVSTPKVFNLTGEDFLIFFPTGSNQKVQNPEYEKRLDQAAEYLKQTKKNVVLIGHADKSGDPKANQLLSQQRAFSIRDELEKRGVANSQVSVRSKGDTEPLNADILTAQENRRVEVRFPTAN